VQDFWPVHDNVDVCGRKLFWGSLLVDDNVDVYHSSASGKCSRVSWSVLDNFDVCNVTLSAGDGEMNVQDLWPAHDNVDICSANH